MKEDAWETISSERHFANAHLEVVTDQVRTPSPSQPRTWTIVHRKAAVVVAPMTRDGKIILIRQERIPIRQAIWEIPPVRSIITALMKRRSKKSHCANFAKKPVTRLPKTARSFLSVIIFHRRDSRMSAATFFWRVQFSGVKRDRRETKENRFSIAVNLLWMKFAA